MEGVEVQVGIEREEIQAGDTALEVVVVQGVQVKNQEVQTEEEDTEEKSWIMEVDHRKAEVMVDTKVQEEKDKIETTDVEDQEVEQVNWVIKIIQKKTKEEDPKKKETDSEKNIMRTEYHIGQNRKEKMVSMRQRVDKEVHLK